jgi:hypothetical protein
MQFNNRYTHHVLGDVDRERMRTTERGRAGELPWVCESPQTHWGIKLGVLGEEFGEVCKAVIETYPDRLPSSDVYQELVQVAAVAVSMAESIIAAAGPIPRDPEFRGGTGGDSIDVMAKDEAKPLPWHEHQKVLMEALDIYRHKNPVYRDAWRTYGWRGSLMQLRSCCERAWRVLWPAAPHSGALPKVDDLLDLINYAVFTIRNVREGNRDGLWDYPPEASHD